METPKLKDVDVICRFSHEGKITPLRVKLTDELETEGVKNLFTIGDGAGVTRGLIQASASGVYVAQTICSRG